MNKPFEFERNCGAAGKHRVQLACVFVGQDCQPTRADQRDLVAALLAAPAEVRRELLLDVLLCAEETDWIVARLPEHTAETTALERRATAAEARVKELEAELESRKATEAAALREMAKARGKAMDAESAADLDRWIGHDKVEEFEAGSLVKKLWDKAKEIEATLKTERRRVTWHRENVSKLLGAYHGADLDEPRTLEAIESELGGENGLVASKAAGWALAKARLERIGELEAELVDVRTKADRLKRGLEICERAGCLAAAELLP